jgi:hypothetical protein
MIEVVINYSEEKKVYQVYEPSTKTLLVSDNISQALVGLSKFLQDQGLEKVDILGTSDITYHLDSATMKAIIESNMALIKRLSKAPTGFMMSDKKFGGSGGGLQKKSNSDKGNFQSNGFKASKKYTGTFGHGAFAGAKKKFGNYSA